MVTNNTRNILQYFKRRSIVILSLFTLGCFLILQTYFPTTNDFVHVTLQHCNCKRKVARVKEEEEGSTKVAFNETTCSKEAYYRGSGQKVVAYSYYGNVSSAYSRERYLAGIVDNLALMPKIYPGWTMRVYMELDRGDPGLEELCVLACADPILDLCHAGELPGTPMVDARKMFPMNWRFFPTLDPQVDVYNCRDLDSRIGDRELAAVNEWLSLGQSVHSMRDHPAHGTAMLGASWGADLRKKDSREKWRNSWTNILKDEFCWKSKEEGSGGPDQIILQHHVWPWASQESVQHDSYLCMIYPNTIPWPVERRKEPNNFVASRVVDNSTMWEICPQQCRPKDHQDWEHC